MLFGGEDLTRNAFGYVPSGQRPLELSIRGGVGMIGSGSVVDSVEWDGVVGHGDEGKTRYSSCVDRKGEQLWAVVDSV
ncbi:hypothetical protein JAAARDRAFT_36228 [Jaapia argillacea MUCL 33604]|uniref:Uncharacterized protein n=1 Tax=Jaapia argillacea MUCL 33604 TaxID=933084 RepID=A0A067Q2B1_9AGAM|nr:hypothetical protein JAAARDRAFT_36228 [Jaapia argillacea MUCL 33604]